MLDRLILAREVRAERCRVWWAERARDGAEPTELYAAFTAYLDGLDRDLANALARNAELYAADDESALLELEADVAGHVEFVRAGLMERLGPGATTKLDDGRRLRQRALDAIRSDVEGARRDARGAHAKLIDLQTRVATEWTRRPEIRAELQRLWSDEEREIWGEAAGDQCSFTAEWDRGFIRSIVWTADVESFAAIGRLLERPVARFVRELSFVGSPLSFAAAVDAIALRPRLDLESLAFEATSKGMLPDLELLEEGAPRLQRLQIAGGTWRGAIDLPRLKELSICADELTPELFEAVLREKRSALRRLELGRAVGPYLSEQWKALLSGRHFPGLSSLGIELSWDGDRLLLDLLGGGLLERLGILDLSRVRAGPLVEIDREAHRLQHLRHLHLPYSTQREATRLRQRLFAYQPGGITEPQLDRHDFATGTNRVRVPSPTLMRIPPRIQGVVPIVDHGSDGDELILVQADAGHVPSWRVGSEYALRIGIDLLAAVADAHDRGFVHGGIDERTVVLVDGFGYLRDFGWAEHLRLCGAAHTEEQLASLPPEQQGGRALPASDVFALGRFLSRLVEPAEDDPVRAVLEQMMDPDPARRPTADEARRCLAQILGARAQTRHDSHSNDG